MDRIAAAFWGAFFCTASLMLALSLAAFARSHRRVALMAGLTPIASAAFVIAYLGWLPLEALGFDPSAVDVDLPMEAGRSPPAIYAWLAACVPFLGIVAGALVRLHLRSYGIDLLWIAAALQLVLVEADLFALQWAGINTSRMGPPALVPTYLTSRACELGQRPRQAATWWVAFSLAMLVILVCLSG